MADSTSLTVQTYNDLAALQPLREDWNSLLADSSMPNIFLTWEWITTWWKWFGQGKPLRIITVRDGSKIIGILPVYIGELSLFPLIKLKAVLLVGDGGPLYPEFLGPIIREQDVSRTESIMAEALLEISRECKVIKFSDILLTSKMISPLLTCLKQNYFVKESGGVYCPYQPLPADYNGFLADLSPKRRKSLRWMVKKVDRQYRVKLECFRDPDSTHYAFERIIEIFKKSKRGQTSNQGFNRMDYLGFHQEVAKASAQHGWLRIYILWFDTVPAAFIYGYYYDRKFWFYQTSFDSTFYQDSPGTIILQMVIESLIKEGAREFDFLRGEEGYKYMVARQERQTTTAVFFGRRGLAYLAYASRHNLLQFIRKGRSIIPKRLWARKNNP